MQLIDGGAGPGHPHAAIIYSSRVWRVGLLAMSLITVGSASAAARTAPIKRVAGAALPSRRADHARLAKRASRLAAQLARRTRAVVRPLPPPPGAGKDIPLLLVRGRKLLLEGEVDEAAATLDVALEAAARRPDAIRDPAALVAGQVMRVQIALARGESERAEALLVRLLRWDADFTPGPDEATPAVKSAFDAARESPAAAAPLSADDAGEACRAVDDLVLVRAARGGAVEIARFDHCRIAASVVARDDITDAAVLDRLAPIVAAPPARRAEQKRSLLSRPWLWVAVGAVAAASIGGGLWLASQSDDDQGGFDVAVRF